MSNFWNVNSEFGQRWCVFEFVIRFLPHPRYLSRTVSKRGQHLYTYLHIIKRSTYICEWTILFSFSYLFFIADWGAVCAPPVYLYDEGHIQHAWMRRRNLPSPKSTPHWFLPSLALLPSLSSPISQVPSLSSNFSFHFQCSGVFQKTEFSKWCECSCLVLQAFILPWHCVQTSFDSVTSSASDIRDSSGLQRPTSNLSVNLKARVSSLNRYNIQQSIAYCL